MKTFHSDSILIGLYTLRGNPLRTILSTLGVIIGVAALVAVLSLGDSLEAFSRFQIEQTTDLQSVTITPRTVDRIDGVIVPRKSARKLRLEDAQDLQTFVSDFGHSTLILTGSEWITVDSDSVAQALLVRATLPGALSVSRDEMAAGRFLKWEDFDASVRVAVLSFGAATRFAGALQLDELLEQRLDTGEIVVGVLAEKERSGPPTVFVPLDNRNTERLAKTDRTAIAILRANELEDVPAMVASIDGWLTSRFGSEKSEFVVASSHQRVQQATQAMLVFKLALGSIAGISLLVGGIGIMNILLASVTERTREIGIRRASGARRGHILIQFLSESIMISFVGSVIGAGLGIAVTFLITLVIELVTEAPLTAVFSAGSLLFAAIAAIVIGLVFGTYPARQAAGIEPAIAMRYE